MSTNPSVLYCGGAKSLDSVPPWAIVVFIAILVLVVGAFIAEYFMYSERRVLPSALGGRRQRGG